MALHGGALTGPSRGSRAALPARTVRPGHRGMRDQLTRDPMENTRGNTRLRAIGYQCASVAFIAVVDTSAKYLTGDLHPIQIVWGYSTAIFAHIALYAAWRAARGPTPFRTLVRTRRPVLQLARAGLLVVTICLLFAGFVWLPIAEATVLNFMAPIFVALLSAPLLGERVDAHRWVAVVAGFAGVLVMVRPGSEVAHLAALFPLGSALAFAGFQLMTRIVSRTDSTLATVFHTGAGTCLWASIIVPLVWEPMSGRHWLGFLMLGTLGTCAHICLVRAFTLAPAALVSPFNYTKLLWVTILGFVVFGDLPGANTLAGSALIVAGGLYVVHRERRA